MKNKKIEKVPYINSKTSCQITWSIEKNIPKKTRDHFKQIAHEEFIKKGYVKLQ